MQRLRVIVAAVRIRRSLRLRSQSGQVDMELVSEAEASDAGAIARAGVAAATTMEGVRLQIDATAAAVCHRAGAGNG